MNIAICEDVEKEQQKLINYIKRYFTSICVPVNLAVFDSGEAFLQNFLPGKYHIIFLDIYLYESGSVLSGMDIAGKIREGDSDCKIIFSTSSEHHAIEGFALQAAHYLVKPISYEHVANALSRCDKVITESMKFIEVKFEGTARKVLLKDIMFAEVYNHDCIIHKKSEQIKTRMTLDELETLIIGLACQLFLRCHRSFLINLDYVESFSEDEFMMQNGSRVLIRKADSKSLKQTYLDYVFQKTKDI